MNLEEIRARSAAATEGPWVSGADYQPSWLPHELITAPENPIVEFTADEQGAADAHFAAHARTDVPALLDRLDQIRRLCENYTPEPPPLFRGPGLSEHGVGFNAGTRTLAEAEPGEVSDPASPGAGHTPNVEMLRELAGALNRMQAKHPHANYVGYGDAILTALGEKSGYMGKPYSREDS